MRGRVDVGIMDMVYFLFYNREKVEFIDDDLTIHDSWCKKSENEKKNKVKKN